MKTSAAPIPHAPASATRTFSDYLCTVVAGIFMAFSAVLFVVPNNFAPAGITGIAVMVQYKLHFSVGYLSLLINIPLCLFAYFVIDRRFALRTFSYCITYSLAYLLLDHLNLEAWKYYAGGVDTIYPAIISGLCGGVCYALVFRHNASTGGTDIVSKYLSKVNPQLNFFWITFAMNAVVAIASYFVYAQNINGVMVYDYKPVCLCLFYCFLSSFIGNRRISGERAAYQFIIVTDHSSLESLEESIRQQLRHSATRLSGYGTYSGEQKQVLLCVVNKHQLVDFENIIKAYPGTFASVQKVDFTVGNFKKIK